METIFYKNKFGDVIKEDVNRFDICGEIKTMKLLRVGRYIGFDIMIEDSNDKYKIVIWENIKGYNPNKIKVGGWIHVRGVIHRQGYTGIDGRNKYYNKYNVTEIIK